jgi:1-aminocyclopropane-1-carboxylate deaminase/D-cysteine desulfhydrase-like pyridoxal-dependent ACC family enzyme
LGVFFDTVVVCSVTGSTHAGMIAGFAGQDRPRRVIGIDTSAKAAETRAQVEKTARNTADLIDLVQSGDIPKDSNVLYAHLGGRPALNAYSGIFR